MKMKLISILMFCLCIESVVSSLEEWTRFKTKYNKVYSSAEEELNRFNIFQQNLESAKQLSARDPRANYGITKFMDLSRDEFRSKFLMNNMQRSSPALNLAKTYRHVEGVPDSFDWRDKNAVTGVKNQGEVRDILFFFSIWLNFENQCGASWAFSVTESVESVCILAGFGYMILSEQQLIDCATMNNGCSSGWPYLGFQYLVNVSGLENEFNYPYTGLSEPCRFRPTLVACKVKSFKYVTQHRDETMMQFFVYNNSPMSVCVDASTWVHENAII